MLNRPVTTPPRSITQATWTSDAQSLPATTASAIAATISSIQKASRIQALVLIADCKAREACGSYRQSPRRAAGSCRSPIGPRRASSECSNPAAYRPRTSILTNTSHQGWISERRSAPLNTSAVNAHHYCAPSRAFGSLDAPGPLRRTACDVGDEVHDSLCRLPLWVKVRVVDAKAPSAGATGLQGR
jgi:hypothetical protein